MREWLLLLIPRQTWTEVGQDLKSRDVVLVIAPKTHTKRPIASTWNYAPTFYGDIWSKIYPESLIAKITWPHIFISTFSELSFLGKINRPNCLASFFFSFGLLHRPMHLSDGSNIMRIVIELKQTIFMNDLKKSALLLIVLGSLLLLKSTFYKVVSNGADGSFLFLIWQHFLVPFFMNHALQLLTATQNKRNIGTIPLVLLL